MSLSTVKKNILGIIITFYSKVDLIEFKEKLKSALIKGLKYHKYLYFEKTEEILKILDLQCPEEITVYVGMCNKMFDNHKWLPLMTMLSYLKEVRMLQYFYDSLCNFLITVILTCPYLLLEVTV